MPTPNSQDLLAGPCAEVSTLTGLGPVLDPIVRRCSSFFGHVARLPEDTPAHQSLRCHIDLLLGHLPDPNWRQCPVAHIEFSSEICLCQHCSVARQ